MLFLLTPFSVMSSLSVVRHRHVNVNQKRYAVASALAATAVPALVMARGHRVEEVPEFPLVVDTSLQSCAKTTSALAVLKALGASAEVEKVRCPPLEVLLNMYATWSSATLELEWVPNVAEYRCRLMLC